MYSTASFSTLACWDLRLRVDGLDLRVLVRVLVRVDGLDLRVREGGIGACLALAEKNRKRLWFWFNRLS